MSAAFCSVTEKAREAAAARSANRRTASLVPRKSRTASPVPRSCSPLLGRVSGGTRHTVSPATRSGSRLVVRTRTWGQTVSTARQNLADSSMSDSQLSMTSSSRRSPSASIRVSASARDGSALTPSTAATRGSIWSPRTASASSTSQTPPGNSPATWLATRTASLLLPMPPAPQSVTTRATPSRSVSSSTSASRPTKPLGSRGRLPPVREACAVSWVIGS